jgi:hypothetical protein
VGDSKYIVYVQIITHDGVMVKESSCQTSATPDRLEIEACAQIAAGMAVRRMEEDKEVL